MLESLIETNPLENKLSSQLKAIVQIVTYQSP